jgi:hypothetical protein
MKLRKHENNVLAWKGDAALLFVARLVLTETYPVKLPIKCLMSRQERAVCNDGLNAYCKRHKLPYGCNVMEIKLGEMVIAGKLEEAKEVVRDIIRHDKSIINMDKQQLVNGQPDEKFLRDLSKHEQIKHEKKRIFDNIKKSNILPSKGNGRFKMIKHINKVVNVFVACKYALFSIFHVSLIPTPTEETATQ